MVSKYTKEQTTELIADRIIRKKKARFVQDQAKYEGYIYKLSFYATMIDIETSKAQYRRFEIYSNVFMDTEIITYIKLFFYRFKPINEYSIWLYNDQKGAIKQVYGEDRYSPS